MTDQPAVTPFREQGCPYCREHWIFRSDQPKFLGESNGGQYYRCEICGSYWKTGFSYPHVVPRERIVGEVPWLEIE